MAGCCHKICNYSKRLGVSRTQEPQSEQLASLICHTLTCPANCNHQLHKFRHHVRRSSCLITPPPCSHELITPRQSSKNNYSHMDRTRTSLTPPGAKYSFHQDSVLSTLWSWETASFHRPRHPKYFGPWTANQLIQLLLD